MVVKTQLDGEMNYLAQSPQLYKQIIVNAGFDMLMKSNNVHGSEQSEPVHHVIQLKHYVYALQGQAPGLRPQAIASCPHAYTSSNNKSGPRPAKGLVHYQVLFDTPYCTCRAELRRRSFC